MSTIKTNCPHCLRKLAADDSLLGQYVDCPVCGKRFRLQARTAPGNAAAAGPDRIAIVPALVFQSIMVAYSVLETIMVFGEADEEAQGVLALLGLVPFVLSIVFTSILHYKCWKALPKCYARLTPGKAIGFLFIPVFNFYWAFPSFGGLGSDCAVVASKRGLSGFTALPGLGLTYAILFVIYPALQNIPVLGMFTAIAHFVIWLLFYRGVTRLLNGLASEGASPQEIG